MEERQIQVFVNISNSKKQNKNPLYFKMLETAKVLINKTNELLSLGSPLKSGLNSWGENDEQLKEMREKFNYMRINITPLPHDSYGHMEIVGTKHIKKLSIENADDMRVLELFFLKRAAAAKKIKIGNCEEMAAVLYELFKKEIEKGTFGDHEIKLGIPQVMKFSHTCIEVEFEENGNKYKFFCDAWGVAISDDKNFAEYLKYLIKNYGHVLEMAPVYYEPKPFYCDLLVRSLRYEEIKKETPLKEPEITSSEQIPSPIEAKSWQDTFNYFVKSFTDCLGFGKKVSHGSEESIFVVKKRN